VARRVNELEAGLPLTDDAPEKIRTTVDALLADPKYRQNAMKIGRSFREAGGAARAADRILQVIGTR
jgi:UDP:flavonoid glycosyltransferase YjiC (YdhE family)